jgi:antitoxin component YwqK of YwqJK toxin-antitoxin module
MKLFLFCIIVFTSIKLFSQVSNLKKYDANETTLHLDDSIVYFRSSMKPFNGIIQKKNDNGKVIFECNYIDGRKDGLAKMWCSDGHLYFAGNYKNGLPNGTFEWWYANGKIAAKCLYSEGLLNGKCEEWYEEFGQLKYEENYKLGRLFGIQRYFTKEGASIGGGDLKDGNGTILIYSENSQLASERHYINGMLDGLVKNYDENGKLKCEGNYQLGKKNGIHKAFDREGHLMFDCNFINGLENGLSTWWLDKDKIEETYSNGDLLQIKSNGKELEDEHIFHPYYAVCDVNEEPNQIVIKQFTDFNPGYYYYWDELDNTLDEICHPRMNNSDNPFSRGGTGGAGNGSGSVESGNGSKSGNGSSSDGGGRMRVRLNDPVLPQYETAFDSKIYLLLTINGNGDVVDAKCIQSKTTCSDSSIINDVIRQIKKQVKYSKDPITEEAITYITINIDSQ